MSHYHLYAIGNALVDTEYEVSDELLAAMGVSKRHMTLIDAEQGGPRTTQASPHHRQSRNPRVCLRLCDE